MLKKMLGLIVALPLMFAAGSAWAGRANYFETQVDLATRTVFGSLYDTRNSADNVQYIGCYLNLIGGVARVTCEARDAAGDALSCGSTNAELVKIAQALTDNGYAYYTCDASNNLTYLFVSTNSLWLP